MSVCFCVCVLRPGVRLSNAETPVYVWKHQQSPGARRPDSEHLVSAAGDRTQSAVRGVCDERGNKIHSEDHTQSCKLHMRVVSLCVCVCVCVVYPWEEGHSGRAADGSL